MDSVVVVVAVASPIVLAIVQGIKSSNLISSRWAMPVACLVGIVVCLLVAFADIIDGFDESDWAIAVLAGVLSGLSAAGLYGGVKAVADAKPDH